MDQDIPSNHSAIPSLLAPGRTYTPTWTLRQRPTQWVWGGPCELGESTSRPQKVWPGPSDQSGRTYKHFPLLNAFVRSTSERSNAPTASGSSSGPRIDEQDPPPVRPLNRNAGVEGSVERVRGRQTRHTVSFFGRVLETRTVVLEPRVKKGRSFCPEMTRGW